MKKFIALAVLATTAAHAADRNIYDIMYLPKAGTTYGFTDVSLVDSEFKTDEVDSDEDFSGYVVNQTVGHSITDRFSLNLSINYANIEGDPEDGKKYDQAKGISDPTISARYRVMEEKFQWDVLGGATISLMDKETDVDSNGDADNDNLQGGNSFFIGTQFGAKSERFQWAVTGLFTHFSKSETEYKVSGADDVKIENDAHNALTLRGDILNKLAEKSFLRSFVAVNFVESFEDDQDPAEETAPSTTYRIGTQYQHLISQDLLLKAGVDYSTINSRSGQGDEEKAWTYTIGANYQF